MENQINAPISSVTMSNEGIVKRAVAGDIKTILKNRKNKKRKNN